LRRILGERGDDKPKFIETVRGHGYRFVAEVRRIDSDDAATRRRGDAESSEQPPALTSELNSSKSPATADGLNAAKSNSSNFKSQTENRNGDDRPAASKHPIEEQSQKTTDHTENSNSQITNPKSNVVALAAWRHEAETDDYQASAAEPTAANEIHEGLQTNAIAVLPFKLIGVAAGDEYLGVGMADALIVSLSKIGDLQVRQFGRLTQAAAIPNKYRKAATIQRFPPTVILSFTEKTWRIAKIVCGRWR